MIKEGDIVKRLLKTAKPKLVQKDLADKVGIGYTALSFQLQQEVVSEEIKKGISDLLGKTVEELFPERPDKAGADQYTRKLEKQLIKAQQELLEAKDTIIKLQNQLLEERKV